MTLKSGLEVTQEKSLKLVQFERLGAVSYSLSTVTMVLYLPSFTRYSDLLIKTHKNSITHLDLVPP